MFTTNLDSILKVFLATIHKLEDYSEAKLKAAEDSLARVAEHKANAETHKAEADKAISIYEKLKDIIG